jgi:hypothetical protein
MTRFWNNRHHLRSKSNDLKVLKEQERKWHKQGIQNWLRSPIPA